MATTLVSTTADQIVDELQEKGYDVLTHDVFRSYASGYKRIDKMIADPHKKVSIINLTYLQDMDGMTELFLHHRDYVECISPYDERINASGKCNDCGRTYPAPCPGEGGKCVAAQCNKVLDMPF